MVVRRALKNHEWTVVSERSGNDDLVDEFMNGLQRIDVTSAQEAG